MLYLFHRRYLDMKFLTHLNLLVHLELFLIHHHLIHLLLRFLMLFLDLKLLHHRHRQWLLWVQKMNLIQSLQ
tara:strand:+ start:542 stop:757 length:216 start_codon:yes stop_codon:yes gene_type:complete